MSAVGVTIGIGANAAILGAAIGAPMVAGYFQGEGSKQAGKAAVGELESGRDENAAAVAAAQGNLDPYANAGAAAVDQQAALSGALGPAAQQQAMRGLQNSPMFQAALQQGNDAILANAAATGGLRGGNTQAALAQFAPQLLMQFMQQQYGNLGQLSGMGAGAAGQQAGIGMQGNAINADLRGQLGATRAGSILGQYGAYANAANSVGNTTMGLIGLGGRAATGGGFGGMAAMGSGASPQTGYAPSPYDDVSMVPPNGAF